MKSFFILLAFAVSGCAVSGTATQQDLIGQMVQPDPDPAPFGQGRAPIPPRPPVANFSGAMGPAAPFSDNVMRLEVINLVKLYGQKDLLITKIWVAGVEKPILKNMKMHDHVFPVRHIEYGDSIMINLPPCHLLDGSGECQARVVAQAASWRYDQVARKTPSNNITCIEMTVSVLEGVARLDWNHRISSNTVTCPGSS